ncbi:DUF4493 domain-containing protein [Odoribacter lunatus]|uniref:DUF4493 domain-containing protein n=1 Tax=Odoribacter lunatus TaxID=2941335 RepID=UPI0020422C46|nr:DUF4493 domain-containing protein [Odoribacter lunatus]
MSKINIGLLLFLSSCSFFSCQDDKIEQDGDGLLDLKVSFNTQTTPAIAVRSTERDYAVVIKNEDGRTIKRYATQEDMPEEIALAAGIYTAEVTSGNNPDAAFSSPYFTGSEKFSVKSNEASQAEVKCTLANAKVSVNYSERIKQYFSSYKTSVSVPKGCITFTEDNQESGYFKIANDSMRLSWELTAINTAGQSFKKNGEFQAKKRQHYSLNFDIDNQQNSEEGGVKVNIIANDDVVRTDTVVMIVLRTLPEITGENFDITVPVALQYKKYENAAYKINIKGTPSIDSILFEHNCEHLYTNNVPYNFNLYKIQSSAFETMQSAGLVWERETDSTVSMDFTPMLDRLETGSYEFTFRVYDSKGKNNAATFQLSIVDADVLTLGVPGNTSGDVWARHARIGGQWMTNDQPEGLQIRYRIKGGSDADWITVPASEIISNKKQFYASIDKLEPETVYEYQTLSSKDGADVPANIQMFTTDMADPLPNSSFDEWDGTYPWAPGSEEKDKFWDTGNKAAEVAKLVLTQSSDVLPSGVTNGKSAWLKSQYTKAFGVADVFAAGNIFSGTFGKIEGTSGASMTFGQPYTSRPQKLKGYYKYNSKTIDWDKKGGLSGKEDRFHIYIILADEAHYLNTTNQSTLFDMDKIKRGEDPHTIAFAELSNEEFDDQGNDVTPSVKMNDYKAFEITLEYYKKNVRPSYIIVAATSSKYGDYYTGGIGSELYIDEFELVFE